MRSQAKRSFLSRPVLVVLGIVVLAGAGWALLGYRGPVPAGGPGGGGPPVTVAVPLARRVTDWREYTGQFAAVNLVDLRARVSGYLTEIHFTDGQMVNQGDLLFVIDPRPYEIALADARAKLTQASSSQVYAHRELSRAGVLQRKDFLSQSTLDQREQESQGAGAGVQMAQAAVRDAELNLQFTRIVAPISGRIGAHQVSVGNLIDGGGSSPTLLTTIVSLDPIHFDFDMSEADYLAAVPAACRSRSSLTARAASPTRATSTSSTTRSTAAPAPSAPAPCWTIPATPSPPACSAASAWPPPPPIRRCWSRTRPSSPTRRRSW